jgi:transposase
MPAQFVKPYLNSNKSDTLNAEAFARAVTRSSMRFVETRAIEQIDVQSLHRARNQLIVPRTRMITQIRGFCLEYGVAIRQGAGVFKVDLPRVVAGQENDLSPAMRRLLTGLFGDLGRPRRSDCRDHAPDRSAGPAG